MESKEDTKPPATELVPTSQNAGLPANPLAGIGEITGTSGQEWHNFPGSGRELWRLKALAQTTDEGAADIVGQVVAIKYWYLQEIQVLDLQTGEYRNTIRTVLVRPDMTAVAFASIGVLRAMASLVQACGPGPYDPPLEVRIKQIETRAGRRMYTIMPAE